MTELGTAYVQIRPSGLAAFKTETETGVKSALLGVGKIVAGALAIQGGFELAKSAISDAAQVQKSTEVIRAEFGKAGQSIIDFADKGGIALGISEHDTEAAAARFGILFKNIGVGKGEAAAMTLNLEKLAGSIAAIRGIDPGSVLGALPLALSGSLRSLRQLGFTFTPLQEKVEALKLGLISNTKQALDPGARAITIYALATQNLGTYQAQAVKHAADAYNVQKRLSAEWDHAKESLAAGLLPQLAKGGTELSNFIEKETRSGKLQRDFATATHDAKVALEDVVAVVKTAAGGFNDFADVVGGKKQAVELIAGAFIGLKVAIGAIKVEGFLTKMGLLGKAAGAEGAAGDVGLLTSRLKALGTLGVVTVGVEVLIHRKQVGDAIGDAVRHATGSSKLGGAASAFENSALGLISGQTEADAFAKAFGLGVGQRAKSLLPSGKQIADQINKENAFLAKSAKDVGVNIAKHIAAGIKTHEIAKAAAETALTALKSAATIANREAARELADAQYQVSQARQTLAQAIIDSKKAVADSITQAKQNLSSIAASIAGSASQTGATVPLGGVLGKRLKELQARLKSGTADATSQQLAEELQNQIAAKANLPGTGGGLQRRLADLADLFNKGAISGRTADLRLDRILKSAGINAAVIQRGQGVAAADQFRAEVAAFKAQVAATAAGPQAKGRTGFEIAIVKPLEVLQQQQKTIAQDQHSVETAQLGVGRAQLHQHQLEVNEQKKTNKLLAKIAANQPSKHDTAELNALLKRQGLSQTARDARNAAHGRHGG